jgi:hypothetical protein
MRDEHASDGAEMGAAIFVAMAADQARPSSYVPGMMTHPS